METTIFRFDFMIKYLYVYAYENNLQTSYFKNIYALQMQCINNFDEVTSYKGNVIKKSNREICIQIFNKIIDSIKTDGFDKKYAIPLGTNNVIINGMHRYSVCSFYNIIPYFTIKDEKGSTDYYYDFFLNRNKHVPLSNAGLSLTRDICDHTALEYIKLNPNIRAMILYPKACATEYDSNDLEHIIESYGIIYYKKKIVLTEIGFCNLIKECYRNENWIGGLFPTNQLASHKSNLCYDNNGNLIIYLIHVNDISKLVPLKEQCRNIFNLGKCSLHMSDFTEDTFRISSSLLNKNSIYFLNYANTDKISKNFRDYFNNLQKTIIISTNDFCITSSAVLDVYGIRKSRDLDYIHKDNLDVNITNVSCHKDKWLTYYHTHRHDIIYNPENHFYFAGMKFATLNVIISMKESRNEEKDINDIRLIKNFLKVIS